MKNTGQFNFEAGTVYCNGNAPQRYRKERQDTIVEQKLCWNAFVYTYIKKALNIRGIL